MELVCVGNALMDVIAFVDEDFAPSMGFHNGSTVHMDAPRLAAVLARINAPVMCSGGGAANAARVAAILGSSACFYGSVGDDETGRAYCRDLSGTGVELFISLSPSPTGLFLSLVRPDGGRTVLVAPGAALDLCLEAPPASLFRPGAVLYLEGFLLRDRSFFVNCIEGGRAAGMRIGLDLGSLSLVERERDFILEILTDYCDWLFANDDEFCALTGLPLSEGLDLLADSGPAVVVKRSERGAIYAEGELRLESPVRALYPVDETGAGDAFAAGFLTGVAKGLPPERCLRLGNRIAEEVLLVPGLSVDPERLRAALTSVSAWPE
jgi:fructokinase